MRDMRLTFDADLSNLSPEEWWERVEEIADEHGYFEPLGESHGAAFLDAGPQLLVTFENAETLRTLPEAAPRGFAYARHDGWSHLAIISHGESWFRDPAIYRYFDRLVDDGFFEDFDRVLFHGAHAGGYAATAYSVAAPGCHVLALRPQATLDPQIASWDTRYLAQRRKDFTTRYGFAPDMIEAAKQAFVAFDPSQRFDAIHAALFMRANVTQLRCVGLGWRIDAALDAMGIHDTLIREAMDGRLTRKRFAGLIRTRRDYGTYLRAIYAMALQRGHPVLAANVCAFVLRQREDPFFARKLNDLEIQGHRPTNPVQVTAA